jgi:hypothetical protein
VAFSCTDSGWTWPGVAQYLPMLAPHLAPRNLVSFANVRPDRTQYRPETDLTTQRDGRIRENARRPAVLDGNLVVRVAACAAPEQGDLCAARAWPTSLTGALGREADGSVAAFPRSTMQTVAVGARRAGCCHHLRRVAQPAACAVLR